MTMPVAYLLGDSARLLRRAFDVRIKLLGVTAQQARLLLLLGLREGQNQGFYADQLEVEAITLCRMLDRMDEAGLIERRSDPADRRAWRIHLTAAGHALLPSLREGIAPLVDAMLAGFSDTQRIQLNEMLEQLRLNLNTMLETKALTHG